MEGGHTKMEKYMKQIKAQGMFSTKEEIGMDTYSTRKPLDGKGSLYGELNL